MAKRVFELAADLGIDSKTIIARCLAEGIPESAIKNHMSPVSAGLYQTIREWFLSDAGAVSVKSIQPWAPITDLPSTWRDLADPQLPSMLDLWREREAELRDSQLLSAFIDKLRRQWAIETGILERLYTLSDSATKALIERGLDGALLTSSDTGEQDDRHVLDMIKDQKDAIDAVYSLVSNHSPLTQHSIRQLHQIITKHQQYSEGIDPQGNTVRRPMPRGEWKRTLNRVERSDGTIVEFCPPLQVENEIDTLLQWHLKHDDLGVPPEIEAAWLHHRFTLIHPFEDGNGRIARCLATFIVVKAGWFPIVITRDDRIPYIAALRAADRGDLAPLVATFSSLQRKAIRQALDLGAETVRSHAKLADALAAIRQRVQQRDRDSQAELRRSAKVADALFASAGEQMKEIAGSLTRTLQEVNSKYWAPFSAAGRGDEQAHYNTFQTKEAAKHFGYFANIDTYHAWAKIDIRAGGRWEILVTLHGSGRTRGFYAVTPMFYQRVRPDEDEAARDRTRIDTIEFLTSEPFEFTYRDDGIDVKKRFDEWIASAIQSGLELWQQRLS